MKVILDELTMTNTVHPKNVLFLMLISIIINMLKNGVEFSCRNGYFSQIITKKQQVTWN